MQIYKAQFGVGQELRLLGEGPSPSAALMNYVTVAVYTPCVGCVVKPHFSLLLLQLYFYLRCLDSVVQSCLDSFKLNVHVSLCFWFVTSFCSFSCCIFKWGCFEDVSLTIIYLLSTVFIVWFIQIVLFDTQTEHL